VIPPLVFITGLNSKTYGFCGQAKKQQKIPKPKKIFLWRAK
tara:strand:- start:409 stop:531 length:123 start_codon:yes stop_codon:yes gene_type:complete